MNKTLKELINKMFKKRNTATRMTIYRTVYRREFEVEEKYRWEKLKQVPILRGMII